MSTRSRRKRLQSATLETTKAASDIQTTTTRSFEQIQRNAALAQQAAVERAEAEKRAKAQAERESIAMRQASRFCKPSPTCANPGNRALMECANGYARAKKEFEGRKSVFADRGGVVATDGSDVTGDMSPERTA